jgi:phosphatidate cytidylyltransferase
MVFVKDTQQRILSALFLVALIGMSLYLGQIASSALVCLCGFIIIDEILVNLVKQDRGLVYFCTQAIYSLLLLLGYFQITDGINLNIFLFLSIIFNLFLMIFLFGERRFFFKGMRYLSKNIYLVGFFVFLPIHSLLLILNLESWVSYLVGLVLICASTDVGGWFFGRQYGKNKLWPKVSPKKTVEGALGGIILCIVVMVCYSLLVFKNVDLLHIVLFLVLSGCSIIGDLVQSKIKRRFSVKDSSSLLPGHGGLFDRFDSHLFVAPLFAMAIEYQLI